MNNIEIWLGIITAIASGTAGLLIFAINRTSKLENRLATLEKESEISEKSDDGIGKSIASIEYKLQQHNDDIIKIQARCENHQKTFENAFLALRSIPKIEKDIAVIIEATKLLTSLANKVEDHTDRIKSLELNTNHHK